MRFIYVCDDLCLLNKGILKNTNIGNFIMYEYLNVISYVRLHKENQCMNINDEPPVLNALNRNDRINRIKP